MADPRRLCLVGEPPVGHQGGTGALAGAATQATVQVPGQGGAHGELPGGPPLDQGDAPARRIGLIGELHEGWALRQAEPALDTLVGEGEELVGGHVDPGEGGTEGRQGGGAALAYATVRTW